MFLPHSQGGTPKSAQSSDWPTRPTNKLYSIASRSRSGRWAGLRCWETHAIRCCLSWRRGPAQAIEDAATLTGCLLKFASDVPAAVRLYEQLRLPRASRLQAMSETNKHRFHMPDGPAQKKRDAEMASGATDWSLAAIAWLYEHDAEVVNGR